MEDSGGPSVLTLSRVLLLPGAPDRPKQLLSPRLKIAQKALYSMIFGPKSPIIRVLRALGRLKTLDPRVGTTWGTWSPGD